MLSSLRQKGKPKRMWLNDTKQRKIWIDINRQKEALKTVKYGQSSTLYISSGGARRKK